MIHEVDDALRELVKREVLQGSDVEVVFEAPTKDWSTRRSTPTVDVYLYDIREDLRRRQMGILEERNEQGIVVRRKPPPRMFKLSYLVTAWTQRPEDEHRLLSSLLSAFVRMDALPMDLLTGSLAEVGMQVPLTIAMPPPEDRQISDVWSALGGELKAALDVCVIAPIDITKPMELGPPVLETPRFDLTRPDGSTERRGGGPARERRAATATPEEELQDEEVRMGADDHPGRVMRIRGMPRPS